MVGNSRIFDPRERVLIQERNGTTRVESSKLVSVKI